MNFHFSGNFFIAYFTSLLLIDVNYRSYNLDLRQDVFVEKDPTKNCTVYPNSEYDSYDKCDQAYVQAIFPGIVPIWNTDTVSKTTRNSSIIEEKKDKYTLLAEGLDVPLVSYLALQQR